ncbi:3-oxoacyl-ACP reductase FabG [Mangrovihabitans endophyticus]|uniref:3-oxoacyl-[acyl-carrier-protein] reductase n=1 Tax=Mangrovihabitans endophyticus TaxID=1751298 RepID=A0A8J3FMU5_9ACTN|nr:3-oxoacyl-ACP reductase FabG [Mangrovihabitans endophyticus]GGK75972.1 3-oxoacyl-[acyl-carrier-protein] reductase [Mangrovihabitans endophyticus]
MATSVRPVAIVSGGSRGIGRAVVHRLARDGLDVAFCYRADRDAAARVVKEADEFGGRTLARQVDVADAAQVRDFVTAAEDALGPVRAVVTSAGITRDKPLAVMDDADWHAVLDTNLTGVYHLCRAAILSLIRQRGGCVVTMASIAGVHGSATQSNYSASKAGILGFTKALAKEYGRYGVRANAVAPGLIDTDMTGAMSDKARQQILSRVPLARFGTAAEVAALVSFLISDDARYLTGQVVGLDGGLVV